MAYSKRELPNRVLPVVTFFLISFSLSGKLVRARPQDNSFTISENSGSGGIGSSELKEVTTKRTDPVTVTAQNDRYSRTLTPFEHRNMRTFLKEYDSVSLWSLLDDRFLNATGNCYIAQTHLRLLGPNKLKRLTLYLKKIKTKIKSSDFEPLKRELRIAFQHIKSKYPVIGNHFKFLILVLFLRLFTMIKSCKNSLRQQTINQNVDSTSLIPKMCLYSKRERDIVHYAEQIIDLYQRSLTPLSQNTNCDHVFENLNPSKRVRRSLRADRQIMVHDYSVKSTIPVTIEERTPSDEDTYRVNLISNFLANSLPDLKLPTLSIDLNQKRIGATPKPYIIVEDVDSSSLPSPESVLEHSSSVSTSSPFGDWTIQSTTQLYPVPLIIHTPEGDRPSHQIIAQSYTPWKPSPLNNYASTESGTLVSNPYIHWNRPASSDYINDWHYSHPTPVPQSPIDDNIHLNFPYPNPPPVNGPPQLTGHGEPVFVEPIVVSSIDQLPTNYPIPMENASLSHNPITVVVGSKPPEIVVLEDFNIQSVVTIEQDTVPVPAGASAGGAPIAGDSEAPAAAAPAAAPAAAAPAAAAPAAIGPLAAGAAAAAGLGALGAAGAAAGIGGAAAGGIGGAAAAGASASAAAGADVGVDMGGAVEGSVIVDAAVASSDTDTVAYAPVAAAETESDMETIYGDVFDFMTWLVSFRFLRTILTALYTMVLPHVSLLMTSVFTIIAFFFPWLYPHIVVPLMSLMSSFPARSVDS